MSETLEPSRVINLGNRPKTQKTGGSTLELIFHIPEGMRLRADLVLELSANNEKILQVPNESCVEVEASTILDAHAPELRDVDSAKTDMKVPAVADVKIHIVEESSDIIPFFSLKLKNSPSIYKTGTTFLKDIANGQKHFGFASMSKYLDDLHLLVYASFINYSLKKPVLVVVKDINDKAFDKYRSNFTQGTLWKWQSHDWGNLCLIDYKQINLYSEEFKHVDLSFITHEFSSVLWALPSGDVQDELHKSSLIILSKINSVTFVIRSGETKNNELKKASAYYQCFDIPVKGILLGESLK